MDIAQQRSSSKQKYVNHFSKYLVSQLTWSTPIGRKVNYWNLCTVLFLPPLFGVSNTHTSTKRICAMDSDANVQQVQQGQKTSGDLGLDSKSVLNDEEDDLKWLIGQMNFLKRNLLTRSPFHPQDELDKIEYFNVYLPYADERLTLKLTTNAPDRLIAAELLFRDVRWDHKFTESLRPINDSWQIAIGKDELWVGFPNALVFNYHRVTNSEPPQIVIESSHARMVFEKLTWFSDKDMENDLTNSVASGQVKEYTPAKRQELKLRYEKMVLSHKEKLQSHPTVK